MAAVDRSAVQHLIRIAVLVAAYFAAARLGLTFAVVNQSATAVWPPTGIALAALLLYGHRLWPGVFGGALLANLATSGSIAASIGIATGNTLEALAAVWLVRRFAGGQAAFTRTASVFRFALLAGLAAPMVGATIGLASLASQGLVAADAMWLVWATWWLGDGTGAVAFTPFLVSWLRPQPVLSSHRDPLEALSLATTAAAVALIAATGLRGYPLEFIFVPVVLWAAFRFGQRAALTCVVGFSAVAVWSALSGEGPFGRLPANDALLYVQGFVAVLAVTGTAVGALTAEHALLLGGLEERVADRTDALRKANQSLVDEVRQRQETERALRSSEASLNEAQALAHIGSWDWDVADNVVRWSDELCRIYGIEPGTLLTVERFFDLVLPEDRQRAEAVVTAGATTGQPFEFEHRFVRPDGELRTLSARGRVVLDPAGQPVRMLGTGQDVTELRRADAQREAFGREQAARREAEEASRMKDHFLAMMSHELRTPLNAVLGWAHVLSEGVPSAADLDKGLQVITRNAQAQQRLIEDLLVASEVTQGRLRIDSEPVDLAAATAGAVESTALAAQAKAIDVATALADGVIVQGDRQRLQQVAWNLLANAVKFTPHGGRIRVEVAREAAHAVLRVTDTGVGLGEDLLPHVFTSFWQGPSDLGQRGLGLGLAIVRAFVEAHGGTVEASSPGPGQGASFVVRLPLSRAAP